MPRKLPQAQPAQPASFTVRLVNETRRPQLPEHPAAVARAVTLPFEAYKHLLSGKPYIRPRRPQKPTAPTPPTDS